MYLIDSVLEQTLNLTTQLPEITKFLAHTNIEDIVYKESGHRQSSLSRNDQN